MPGCGAPGEYRAPKSRNQLHDYWWFCLEHVRGYNAAWDYYKGMSPGEIEAQLRADTSWQRPTWPLGQPRPHGWTKLLPARPAARPRSGRVTPGHAGRAAPRRRLRCASRWQPSD